TYSDGKLYTRSTKRGDIQRILQLFHYFGAHENVLYEAHPHIGTNKLPHIITAMRDCIVELGGIVAFNTRVTDLMLTDGKIAGVKANGISWKAAAVILATGHSARDIFELLERKEILIHAKPFALGVRIEHPQHIVDSAQYHSEVRDPNLPPASYSLVTQENGRGVFSFCMCPGGIIAPAATAAGEIVVNGWSPSKRNNPYANSGTVVTVDEADFAPFGFRGPLAAMHYQAMVEQTAFKVGGGKLVAPAQRLADFTEGHVSATLPDCSYQPGLLSCNLSDVLPAPVDAALKKAVVTFGRKMKGYFTNEAVVVATESRTSSPVRIPRDADTLMHPQVDGLFPCAEGAGYAGGIVSAAMDGERCATMAVQYLKTGKEG
ncbi:MAG: FAD-binding protein, partial [Chitinophagia bacterium]|nr:FAD-binding protein [Chitinophagia bacterium]